MMTPGWVCGDVDGIFISRAGGGGRLCWKGALNGRTVADDDRWRYDMIWPVCMHGK